MSKKPEAAAALETLTAEGADPQHVAAVADFLAGEAPEPGANPEPEASAPAVDLRAEIGDALGAVAGMLAPALPSIGKLYTPDTCARVGDALGAVCEKHGWFSGGLLGENSVEIKAALVVVPLAVATYVGVKADMAAMDKAPPPAAAPAAPTPAPEAGQDTAAPDFGRAAPPAKEG